MALSTRPRRFQTPVYANGSEGVAMQLKGEYCPLMGGQRKLAPMENENGLGQ